MRGSCVAPLVLLLACACGTREEEDDYWSPSEVERFAADPSFEQDAPTLPTRPPAKPVAAPTDAKLFSEAAPGIYEMALDDTHLYWITDGIYGPSQLWRADRQTAESELLVESTERVYALTLDDTHVYFTETANGLNAPDSGRVLSVSKAGGTPQVLTTADDPTSIASDDTHVYYNRGSSPDGSVLRVSKAGGVPEVVIADLDNPWDLALDDTRVYVSEMNRGRIIAAPKTGGEVEQLASGWLGTGWLAVGDGKVFFQTCADGPCEPAALRSVETSGGGVFELQESPRQPGKVAYGADWVLWGNWFVPLAGDPGTRLFEELAPDLASVAVAADASALFVADHASGRIFTASLRSE